MPIPRHAESSSDPDYAAIMLLGQFRDGRVVIWQAWRYRDVPGAIEWEIERILKEECPRGTTVGRLLGRTWMPDGSWSAMAFLRR